MRYILTGFLFALASAPCIAQGTPTMGSLERTGTALHGTYDMVTGFQQSTRSHRSGPATIFDSTAGATYYYAPMDATAEFIDEMAFAATDLDGNEQINGIYWEYCSATPDSGTLDVVDVELRFYNDTILGAGPTGWFNPVFGLPQFAQCAYGIAGLPGDTLGTVTCWGILIDLAWGYECSLPQETTPGGMTEFNGIGWMYLDGGSGPVIDSNWGPGGPGTAPPGYGSQDYYEVFDLTSGSWYTGTFWFGGAPKAQASFVMTLFGNGILDTDVVNADVPDVGDILCLGSDIEFRTGAAVTWSLAEPGTPGLTYAMVVGTDGASAGFGAFAGPGTTLLVDPGSVLIPPTPLLMSGATPAVTTQPLPGLPPTVYAQAFGFSGAVGPGNATEGSNALRHRN